MVAFEYGRPVAKKCVSVWWFSLFKGGKNVDVVDIRCRCELGNVLIIRFLNDDKTLVGMAMLLSESIFI